MPADYKGYSTKILSELADLCIVCVVVCLLYIVYVCRGVDEIWIAIHVRKTSKFLKGRNSYVDEGLGRGGGGIYFFLY